MFSVPTTGRFNAMTIDMVKIKNNDATEPNVFIKFIEKEIININTWLKSYDRCWNLGILPVVFKIFTRHLVGGQAYIW